MTETEDDDVEYLVVVNDEEQYSIWPVVRELPAGWHDAGMRGTKQACLAHIDVVWTDMRPKSVREAMERDG
jgi:MbtH protein